MSEQLGKLLTCDRCSAQVFLKYKDTKELDGGFTRVNNFEDMPDGWSFFGHLFVNLCPECSKELELILEVFMENTKEVT